MPLTRSLACSLLLLAATAGNAQVADANPAAEYGIQLEQAAERMREGRAADAIGILTELTRSHPNRPEAFNNLAVLYARQGNLNQARDLLARAINTHPSYATSYHNLNEVLGELAARAYDQALQSRSEQRPRPQLALIEQAPALTPTVTAVALAGSPAQMPQPGTASRANASRPPIAAPPQPASSASTAKRDSAKALAAEQTDPRAEAVLATVNAWAQDWSEKNVSGYLDHYDRLFRPARGLTRAQWEKQRKQRLTRPRFIRVEIVKPAVRFDQVDLAVVRFEQRYRSSSMRSNVVKELRLRRRGSRWRILEERV